MAQKQPPKAPKPKTSPVARSKEAAFREMMSKDPEKVAAMLREILKDK